MQKCTRVIHEHDMDHIYIVVNQITILVVGKLIISSLFSIHSFIFDKMCAKILHLKRIGHAMLNDDDWI